MALLTRVGPMPFPAKGYSGRASTRTAMRVHFWYQHGRDTVVILEEGNLPHPRCSLCDIMVPCKDLNGTHRPTAQCTQGADRRRQRLVAKKEREVTVRAFSAYGRPLEMVNSFKYRGRVILAMDNNWTVVVRNLAWGKTVWRRISRILSR